jgi:hypothetical protein
VFEGVLGKQKNGLEVSGGVFREPEKGIEDVAGANVTPGSLDSKAE